MLFCNRQKELRRVPQKYYNVTNKFSLIPGHRLKFRRTFQTWRPIPLNRKSPRCASPTSPSRDGQKTDARILPPGGREQEAHEGNRQTRHIPQATIQPGVPVSTSAAGSSQRHWIRHHVNSLSGSPVAAHTSFI